jgi:hypothetical protein
VGFWASPSLEALAKKAARELEEKRDRIEMGQHKEKVERGHRAERRAIEIAAKELNAWAPDTMTPTSPHAFRAAVKVVDPKEHKLRLEASYDRYMKVYERGLDSEDIKIAIKCADILRGMHIGTAGVGAPAQDVRNAELMVLGSLPNVMGGPTVGELREQEQEAEELEDSEFEDIENEMDEPPQRPIHTPPVDPPGVVRLPPIELDYDEEYTN